MQSFDVLDFPTQVLPETGLNDSAVVRYSGHCLGPKARTYMWLCQRENLAIYSCLCKLEERALVWFKPPLTYFMLMKLALGYYKLVEVCAIALFDSRSLEPMQYARFCQMLVVLL